MSQSYSLEGGFLMHCPQCGRQVLPDDARFCKHCGFALGAIKDLLIPSASTQNNPRSLLNIPIGVDPRSLKGVNQAVYLMLIAFVPLLLVAAQGLFSFALLPAMLLMKVFFALLALPLLRFGYALYEAKQERKPKKMSSQIGGRTQQLDLPPAQRPCVTAFSDRRIETAEIVEPPSVTESTTKLLKQSQDHQ
jgi:hypothetical protein